MISHSPSTVEVLLAQDKPALVRAVLLAAAVLLDKNSSTVFNCLGRCSRCGAGFTAEAESIMQLGTLLGGALQGTGGSLIIRVEGPVSGWFPVAWQDGAPVFREECAAALGLPPVRGLFEAGSLYPIEGVYEEPIVPHCRWHEGAVVLG